MPRAGIACISARLAQLAREAGRTTAQHIAGYERQRRHATLVAITLELGTLTDQAIDLFERLVGTMFSKAETRHARAFQADGRAYENQQHRASGLNLLVAAITLWNTRYLNRAIAAMRETEDVPDHLLAHLSPLGWEHINLTGDYVWSAADEATENRDGLRSLRPPVRPSIAGGVSSRFVRLCVSEKRFVTSGRDVARWL